MAIIVLLNNFMHDFSAAGWLFGSVVLWSILRQEIPEGNSGKITVRTLETVAFLMRLALVGIVIFGVVRALAYNNYEWNTAAGDGQVTLLMVKHVILTAAFIWGLVYYIKACRFIKRAGDEKSK